MSAVLPVLKAVATNPIVRKAAEAAITTVAAELARRCATTSTRAA